MTESTDAQAVIDLALAHGEPTEIDPDLRYVTVVPDGGTVAIIDPLADRYLPNPRRANGTTSVLDVESFAALYAKHADPDVTEVYADPAAYSVTAVVNADGPQQGGEAGHRDHRIVLQCKHTPAWRAWTGFDGKLLGQKQFAEFLEDRLPDIVNPPGATMLELATTFQATVKAEFKGAVALSSSTRQITYEETAAAKAGQKGQIEIPATFELGLAPFEGMDAYRVVARFRYNVSDGNLQIGYRLQRPDLVLQEAFDGVRQGIQQATEATLLLGTPPAARGDRA